jgi:hypothetical protein
MSSHRILDQKLSKPQADFCHAPTPDLTQHNPHGPDDSPKTIDYHHLDMSRHDGMDERGIDWLYGCHLTGCWLKSGANHRLIFVTPQPQILKLLIITIWTWQEMMVWMSMELIGSLVVIR